MDRQELTRALLTALREVPGLRPAVPVTRSWLPWDAETMAVDVDDDTVEVRLVALSLPLEPLLREATTALRRCLRDSPWRDRCLRLVVTDLDAGALTGLVVTES